MENNEDTAFSARLLADFHARLHTWYAAHGRRELPWRNTRDAYHIYVSEVMLQQTQVATVLNRYYFPFLKRFPTIEALAEAPREEVLKAWQGLGYYSRAVNLHRAAQQIQARGLGLEAWVSPSSPKPKAPSLPSLPGIGKNTANAIAAFALRQPVPVMEANVKRVLCRIFALKTPGEKELWAKAEALLDHKNPFDYNQAMMDIGSAVCTPRAPACPACPANVICKGQSKPEVYPERKAKKSPPLRRLDIFVRRSADGKYHATPRATRFLHGMYHFMEKEAVSSPPPFRGRIKEGVAATTPTLTLPLPGGGKLIYLGQVSHAYSHFRLEAEVWLMPLSKRAGKKNWFSLKELETLPHARTEKKIISLLKARETIPSPARKARFPLPSAFALVLK